MARPYRGHSGVPTLAVRLPSDFARPEATRCQTRAKHAGHIVYCGVMSHDGLLTWRPALPIPATRRRRPSHPPKPAVSPPVTQPPAGEIRPLPGHATSAVFDAATASLVVLGPGRASRRWSPRCRQRPGQGRIAAGPGDRDDRRRRRRTSIGRHAAATSGSTSRSGRVSQGAGRRPRRHRLHRDRPPRRRQAGARQRRRRRVHAELRHRGRSRVEDLRARGCPCHTRKYGRRAGPRPDVGHHGRRQRRQGRTGTARGRGRDHAGRRSCGPGAGRRHPRRCACWCSAPTR